MVDTTFDLWKSRHDDLFKYYQELRQLYYDRTGIDFVPTEFVLNRIAPTDEDKAWLKSIGINIDGGAQ
jgi:hypothetical protein